MENSEKTLEVKSVEVNNNGLNRRGISNKATNSLKIYWQSKKYDDKNRELSAHLPTLGIYETIKNYIGVELKDVYYDKDGRIFIREGLEQSDGFIEFDSSDEIEKYIEYLSCLGIFYKLNNEKTTIVRDDNYRTGSVDVTKRQAEMNEMAKKKYGERDWHGHAEEFRHVKEEINIYSSKESIFIDKALCEQVLTLEEVKAKLKEIFSDMSMKDIENSNLSPFEIRKLIAIKYENIKLSEEEIEAVNYYKGAMFKKFNQFLIGNLEIEDEEKFFRGEFEDLIKKIGLVYSAQKKFQTDRDIMVMRTDSVGENKENGVVFDNFVSTSIAPQVFSKWMDGVIVNTYKIIRLPKGSCFIPTDIITESRMEKEASAIMFGANDEAEYLLPMCELETKKKGIYKDKLAMVMEVTKQNNPAEVISKRIKEYREKIIQYLGEEKLAELEGIVEQIREIDSETKEEQETKKLKKVEDLGKETLGEQEDTQIKKTVTEAIEKQRVMLKEAQIEK